MSNKRLQTHADCGSMHKTSFWFDLIFLQQTPPPIFYYLRRFSPLVPPIFPLYFFLGRPCSPRFLPEPFPETDPDPPQTPPPISPPIFETDFFAHLANSKVILEIGGENRRENRRRNLTAATEQGFTESRNHAQKTLSGDESLRPRRDSPQRVQADARWGMARFHRKHTHMHNLGWRRSKLFLRGRCILLAEMCGLHGTYTMIMNNIV